MPLSDTLRSCAPIYLCKLFRKAAEIDFAYEKNVPFVVEISPRLVIRRIILCQKGSEKQPSTNIAVTHSGRDVEETNAIRKGRFMTYSRETPRMVKMHGPLFMVVRNNLEKAALVKGGQGNRVGLLENLHSNLIEVGQEIHCRVLQCDRPLTTQRLWR